MTKILRPLPLSALFHTAMILIFFIVVNLRIPLKEMVEVPIVISAPEEIQNLTEVKDKPKVVLKSVNEPIPESTPKREVFGANRNSYTDDLLGNDGVEAKKGNTLAKEVDKTKLEASDADSLPTPTEEYLVSEMPSVLSEVRPVYPPEAKSRGLEGSVSLDVLVDENGKVRQVSVIEGAEIFRTGAVEAMKKFKFRPAKVDGKSVAVRIRYSLKFQLEY